jgi:GT2 family glycosyltransferase
VTGPLELDRLNPAWLAGSRGRRTESGEYDYYGIFACVSGGNMGMHRRLWRDVGGFREHFVPEDMEFSLRAWRQGARVLVAKEAVIHYRYRTEPKRLYRQGFAYGLGRVAIARMLSETGGPRPPRFAGWRSWLWLARHPPLKGPAARAVWCWVLGNRLGHVVGSLRTRTLLI